MKSVHVCIFIPLYSLILQCGIKRMKKFMFFCQDWPLWAEANLLGNATPIKQQHLPTAFLQDTSSPEGILRARKLLSVGVLCVGGAGETLAGGGAGGEQTNHQWQCPGCNSDCGLPRFGRPVHGIGRKRGALWGRWFWNVKTQVFWYICTHTFLS